MENDRAGAILPPLDLERDADLPLYGRVYARVRDAILDGKLAPGSRLPSTRTLSHDLDLSRNTILKAFDQLLVEGYVECRIGDGTYVSSAFARSGAAAPEAHASRPRTPRTVSVRARRSGHAEARRAEGSSAEPVAQADLELFPFETWNRLLARCQKRDGRAFLQTGDPRGHEPLRRRLAEHLATTRGMTVDAERIVILPSRRQALDLVLRLLVDPGETVLLEDPSDPDVRDVVRGAGGELHPLPVDHRGASLEVRDLPKARIAYVTPAHQHPLGPTLTLERRLRLLAWAERQGAWIVEEDHDAELRHRGRPLQALQGIDGTRRVLQIGGFESTLFPALRLSWLVAPADLVRIALEAGLLAGDACPTLVQATLHEFLAGGHYASHVRRLRTSYRQRRRTVQELVERHLGDDLQLEPGEAGTHVVGWLPVDVEDVVVARDAAGAGLALRALSEYYLKKPIRGGLVLGFGNATDAELERGIEALAATVRTSIERQRRTAREAKERAGRFGSNGHSIATS